MRQSFMDPPPVGYIQTLHEELLSDCEGAAGCYTDHYNKWLYGSALPDADGSESSNVDFARSTFVRMDLNGDGKISRADAVASFPVAVREGAIRTPENDGAAFLRANDKNHDDAVTLDELEAAMRTWTRVMHEVGTVWQYVDGRNAASGGAFMEYGAFVDAIRFNYTASSPLARRAPSHVTFEFDERGNPSSGKEETAQDEYDQEPEQLRGIPQQVAMDVPVPKEPSRDVATTTTPTADFPVRLSSGSGGSDGASFLLATIQGDPIGFLVWPLSSSEAEEGGARFLGHFTDGKRVGKGIYSSAIRFEEQSWQSGEDTGFKLR